MQLALVLSQAKNLWRMPRPRALRRSGAAVRRSTTSLIRLILDPKERTCP